MNEAVSFASRLGPALVRREDARVEGYARLVVPDARGHARHGH